MRFIGTDQKKREADSGYCTKNGEHPEKCNIHIQLTVKKEQQNARNHNNTDEPTEKSMKFSGVGKSIKKAIRNHKAGLPIPPDKIPENSGTDGNEKNHKKVPYALTGKPFAVVGELKLHPAEENAEGPCTENITTDFQGFAVF